MGARGDTADVAGRPEGGRTAPGAGDGIALHPGDPALTGLETEE
ncbi:hypothetical protein [Actinomadura macra]|nr:hypothetical protein [Actinomadura macra]